MQERKRRSSSAPRRSFLKLIAVVTGTSLVSPWIASCAPKRTDEFEVDIVIEQNDIHYSPATLKVPRGATVTWLNKSYYSQSATCDPDQARNTGLASVPDGAQPWDSGILYPGQRFSRTFDVPGIYIYFSAPRLSPNTVGTIIVE